MTAEERAELVRALVDTAPALSETQVARLAVLLAPAPNDAIPSASLAA